MPTWRELLFFFPILASPRGLGIARLKFKKYWRRRRLAAALAAPLPPHDFLGRLGLERDPEPRLNGLRADWNNLAHLSLPRGNAAAAEAELTRADEILEGHQRIFGQRLYVGWPPRWDWCWDHLGEGEVLRGDHRSRWEVGRLAGLLPLARGAYLAREAETASDLGGRYAHAYVEALRDHGVRHPGPGGILWEHGIEAGLRVVSLAQALPLIAASEAFERSHLDILRILDRHVLWLAANLSEDKIVRGNHLLAELAGLVAAGHLLPSARSAWWRGRDPQGLLEREILRQFHPDGVNVEQSLTYEKFILEFLLVPAGLAHARGRPFAEEVVARLRATVEHLREATAPDGELPRIGDCDSSRGADWGDENPHASGPILERAEGILIAASPIPSQPPEAGTSTGLRIFEFPHGGHVVVRDSSDGRRHFLYLRCGPFGWGERGPASHSHADFMAPVLYLDGKPVLLDPGVYGYVVGDELRDGFRTWDAHSAVVLSPGRGPRPAGIFRWRSIPPPGRLAVRRMPEGVVLDGEVRWRGGPGALIWHRSLSYNQLRESWIIEDRFSKPMERPVTWVFRFAPGIGVEQTGRPGVLRLRVSDQRAWRLVLEPEGAITLGLGKFAPAYGQLLEAPVLTRVINRPAEPSRATLEPEG